VYQFRELNRENYSVWDKRTIETTAWARLPAAAKGVYPVVRAFANRAGQAWPCELTIAIHAGQTEKTTREGVNGLCGFPGVTLARYVTKRGRLGKRWLFAAVPVERGRWFPFHRIVVDGGNWLQLLPAAQALYPVMRCFGYFDQGLYEKEQAPDDEAFTEMARFAEDFAARTCDFCEAERSVLAHYAGIATSSMSAALRSLEEHYLIRRREDGRFAVYLRPPQYYKRDWLNEQVRLRYHYSFEPEAVEQEVPGK
jgi:DNA-binding transcriptional ArsR family regulator